MSFSMIQIWKTIQHWSSITTQHLCQNFNAADIESRYPAQGKSNYEYWDFLYKDKLMTACKYNNFDAYIATFTQFVNLICLSYILSQFLKTSLRKWPHRFVLFWNSVQVISFIQFDLNHLDHGQFNYFHAESIDIWLLFHTNYYFWIIYILHMFGGRKN